MLGDQNRLVDGGFSGPLLTNIGLWTPKSGIIEDCADSLAREDFPLAKTLEIKPEEQFAREYVDRLILEKLTEMEAAVKLSELADKLSKDGIGLATVRSLLASNPERFAYHERRWIPASRLQGAGRPLHEIARLVLHRFGGPMPINLLQDEVVRVRQGNAEEILPVLTRIFDTDDAFAYVGPDHLALTSWGFVASDETLERALALNKVTREQFEADCKALEGFDFRTEGSIEEALKKVAPISLTRFGAVAWSKLNPQDPHSVGIYHAKNFLQTSLDLSGFVFAPDGVIYPEAEAKKWISSAIKLADKLAPQVDVDDAAPIEVKAEDADRLAKKIVASADSVTATKLLEEFYEITPSNKTFPDDMANIMTALKADSRVVWVGGDRFRAAGTVPDFILEVPEPFHFVATEDVDEEGDLIDVELTDDGLSSSLRKLLAHPLAMDVLDEDIAPTPKTMPESVRLVLKSIHRELGTFPLAQLPTSWLDHTPGIQELLLIDPDGRELQAWVNMDARLIFNLLEWWFEQQVESGSVFTLTKTTKPNVLEFAWLDQPDPVVFVATQRMEELRSIGERAADMTTLDILQEVMTHWPKGADFLTILAEVNVVRRSTRRLVASLLSSYQCFYQRSGSPVWHYDAKKVELGFDKTKKKFIKK
jgi:hypothetical protein